MKKFLSVFVKTAAVIASVAGIAYVVKQVLDKKAEMNLFDDFDEDFEDDFEDDEDEACDAAEETAEAERGYVDINIASAEEETEDAETPSPAADKNYLYKIFNGSAPIR